MLASLRVAEVLQPENSAGWRRGNAGLMMTVWFTLYIQPARPVIHCRFAWFVVARYRRRLIWPPQSSGSFGKCSAAKSRKDCVVRPPQTNLNWLNCNKPARNRGATTVVPCKANPQPAMSQAAELPPATSVRDIVVGDLALILGETGST